MLAEVEVRAQCRRAEQCETAAYNPAKPNLNVRYERHKETQKKQCDTETEAHLPGVQVCVRIACRWCAATPPGWGGCEHSQSGPWGQPGPGGSSLPRPPGPPPSPPAAAPPGPERGRGTPADTQDSQKSDTQTRTYSTQRCISTLNEINAWLADSFALERGSTARWYKAIWWSQQVSQIT